MEKNTRDWLWTGALTTGGLVGAEAIAPGSVGVAASYIAGGVSGVLGTAGNAIEKGVAYVGQSAPLAVPLATSATGAFLGYQGVNTVANWLNIEGKWKRRILSGAGMLAGGGVGFAADTVATPYILGAGAAVGLYKGLKWATKSRGGSVETA